MTPNTWRTPADLLREMPSANENLSLLTDVLLCCGSGGSVVAAVTKVVGSDPCLLHSEAHFLKTQNLQRAPEAVSLGHDGRFQIKSN